MREVPALPVLGAARAPGRVQDAGKLAVADRLLPELADDAQRVDRLPGFHGGERSAVLVAMMRG
jgi:hypothetical protein